MKKLFISLIIIGFIIPVFSNAEEIASKPAGEVVQEAPDAAEGGYVYEPKGRRDPFEPLIALKKRNIKEKPRALGTLEGYDITDFKLLAIVNKMGKQSYGLLLSTDNKSFTIREGTIVGLNNGKVIAIQSDKVVIEEYIEDYKGELRPRQVVLELRKEEGK